MKELKATLIILLILALSACARDGKPDGQVENRGSGTENWSDALPRAEWSRYERVAVDDDWFEAYRILDGIYAIYEPGQFEEVISFLITGQEGALLFDTGLGIGDMRSVVQQLTDLAVIVLNSHSHYDHIGGKFQFETIYAMDTEFTRGRAAGIPNERMAEFVSEGWVWKPLPKGFVGDEYHSQPFVIRKCVAEGDVIDVGGAGSKSLKHRAMHPIPYASSIGIVESCSPAIRFTWRHFIRMSRALISRTTQGVQRGSQDLPVTSTSL